MVVVVEVEVVVVVVVVVVGEGGGGGGGGAGRVGSRHEAIVQVGGSRSRPGPAGPGALPRYPLATWPPAGVRAAGWMVGG